METLLATAKKIAPGLSQFIQEEENNRRISGPVLEMLRVNGFHRLFMPKALGGLEVDPLETAKLVEEVALHNTAAGWSMMVANVSTWWCRMLPDQGIEEIYESGPDTLIAGAFHPPMQASRVPGGYRINGRSPLTSNIHEAKWIFVSALVMEQGQVKINHGRPEVIGVFMRAEDCEIVDTWYTSGMKATDSNDVRANEVYVPEFLSFPLAPDTCCNSYYKGPLYRFSAIGTSVCSLIAPISLAIARNAIQHFKVLAENKTSFGSSTALNQRGAVQRKLGIAEALVQSSRAYLYATISDCWARTLSGEHQTLEQKAGLLLAATHSNQSCVQAVDLIYSAAGSSAIYLSNQLARYFADIQVIRQHGFANDSRYETAAQAYLGLTPDLPVLAF